MVKNVHLPETLFEAITWYQDYQNCHDTLVAMRWQHGVTCPHCGSKDVFYMEKYRRWHCRAGHPAAQFTLRTGTLFESSRIPLSKWMAAIWLIVNSKNSISSHEIGRSLGVTQKTAWFMGHRIRLALQQGSFEMLLGDEPGDEVEIDETFIGGKARNMHSSIKARRITGRGPADKEIVLGILERGGIVRLEHVANRKKWTLQREVRATVAAGAALYSDDLASYEGLQRDYAHKTVNHAISYVEGRVHTNTLESFWALLKRSLNGTWVSVEPFHLFRYLDEQAYRYNERHGTDSDRFRRALRGLVGKRLTYNQLRGRTGRGPKKGTKRKRPART